MAGAGSKLPPTRTITRGPGYHWFGYYDKLEFDPVGRFVLGMEVDFEHRSPTPDDVIKIGMVDLQDGDRWIELGESRAWCWQQGCMLQWRPGSKTEVLWNDRQQDRFVCRILDVETRQLRTIPHPGLYREPRRPMGGGARLSPRPGHAPRLRLSWTGRPPPPRAGAPGFGVSSALTWTPGSRSC